MEIYKVDNRASPATGLCLNDIVEIFDLFKQFGKYPDALLSNLQIEAYPGRENEDREVVYVVWIRDTAINTDWRIVLNLSYRLAHHSETDFDIEGPYKKEHRKSRISHHRGRFILDSGKLYEENSDRILEVRAFLKTLAFDITTPEAWARSEREMFVTCSNPKCPKFRVSKNFNAEDVRLFSNKFSNIESLKKSMRCSVCGSTHPDLTLFPIRDGVMTMSS